MKQCQKQFLDNMCSLGHADAMWLSYKPGVDNITFSVRFARELKYIIKNLANQADHSTNREIIYRVVHSLLIHPKPLSATAIQSMLMENKNGH